MYQDKAARKRRGFRTAGPAGTAAAELTEKDLHKAAAGIL